MCPIPLPAISVVQLPEENDPSQSTHTYAQIPWTAARCVRLLRPLSSKIATLKRLRKAQSEKAIAAQRQPAQPANLGTNIETNTPRSREESNTPRPQKRLRRTYSSRCRPREPNAEAQGKANKKANEDEILELPRQLFLPAKIVNTHLGNAIPAVDTHGERPDQRGQWKTKRSSQALGLTDHEKLISGIQSSLEALLKATKPEDDGISCGSRSLFSMCLSTVPEYISDEECWSKEASSDDEADISSSIYNELEDFGASGAHGYKALRQVVRSHGLHILSDSIVNKIVNIQSGSDIVRLCLMQGAYDEAQILMEAILSVVRRDSGVTGSISFNHTRLMIQLLQDFVGRTGRYGFQFKCLSRMLEDRQLGESWRRSALMSDCWNAAIRSVSLSDTYCQEAAALLRVTIRASYLSESMQTEATVHNLRLRQTRTRHRLRYQEYPSNRAFAELDECHHLQVDAASAGSESPRKTILEDTTIRVSSILTVLATIAVLQQENVNSGQQLCSSACPRLLREIGLQACQIAEICDDPDRRSCVATEHMALPLLAANLPVLTSSGGADTSSLSGLSELGIGLLQSLRLTEKARHSIGTFVCSVAQCCRRVMPSIDEFILIRSITQNISKLDSKDGSSSKQSRLGGAIAAAAAHSFHLTNSQPEHVEWALLMEQKATENEGLTLSNPTQKTPAKGRKPSQDRYRWEEGICEWILRTPIVMLSRTDSPRPSPNQTPSLRSKPETGLPSERCPDLLRRVAAIDEEESSPSSRSHSRCEDTVISLEWPHRNTGRVLRSSKCTQQRIIHSHKPLCLTVDIADEADEDELSTIVSSEESSSEILLDANDDFRRSQGRKYTAHGKHSRSLRRRACCRSAGRTRSADVTQRGKCTMAEDLSTEDELCLM